MINFFERHIWLITGASVVGALLFYAALPDPGISVLLWPAVLLGAVFAVASYINIAFFPVFVAIVAGMVIRLSH